MKDQNENKIDISTLQEIIYELYKEDVKRGKLRKDLFRDYEKSVGKSAPQSQTFHQTTFNYE